MESQSDPQVEEKPLWTVDTVTGSIQVMADDAEVQDGCLILKSLENDGYDRVVNLVVNSGKWKSAYRNTK